MTLLGECVLMFDCHNVLTQPVTVGVHSCLPPRDSNGLFVLFVQLHCIFFPMSWLGQYQPRLTALSNWVSLLAVMRFLLAQSALMNILLFFFSVHRCFDSRWQYIHGQLQLSRLYHLLRNLLRSCFGWWRFSHSQHRSGVSLSLIVSTNNMLHFELNSCLGKQVHDGERILSWHA
jgi:hypothetical protein